MTDRFSIRAVVLGLILIVLGTVGALLYALTTVTLTSEQQGQITTALVALGSGGLGALTALLAHTASQAPSVEAQAQPIPGPSTDPAAPAPLPVPGGGPAPFVAV